MAGRLITPPDIIAGENSILLLDPSEIELTSLVLWLKTVPDHYDVHVYYQDMNNGEWLSKVLQGVKLVLKSQTQINLFQNLCFDNVVEYGPGKENQDLLQYFLKKNLLER
jgi:hypothetical protein